MGNEVLDLVRTALWLVLALSGPPILAAAGAGLLVAFIQAATQLQEQTIQFAVKLAVIMLVLFVMGTIIASSMYNFANRIFTDFGSLAG